ncbi:MAG: radical SAM family heme chaperone HemW [Acidobacteria bacterium]|nr:radical SAM family heme chaperone HemW [Acidobacteriota bacterium]MCW5950294.1 radical SAM family heme chaperone HemW [Pyrinomonadaceae bacterium]
MPSGVYLHIPFCRSRCSYCDFATDVYRSNDAVDRYVNALCAEIRGGAAHLGEHDGIRSDAAGRIIDTIYFGGGTPSLLEPEQVEKILTCILSVFSVASGAEITMEMNPATVTLETLRDYKNLGINRASFGVQTFDDRALRLLARGHDANDARETFRMLRGSGFENVSFDLIAGLPNQTLQDWERNLDEAIDLRPEHLSLYLLEIHEGTPLAEQVRSGRQPQPDEDLAAAMYETMLDRLGTAGYEQYEISNFSKAGFASRHNTKYWTMEPVFGFGVSAHSFDGAERYSNDRDTASYVASIENGGSAEIERTAVDLGSETVFLGLRLTEGIDLGSYRERFGTDLAGRCAELEDKGLVEISDGRLRLTRKGMLFSNEVFAEFV